MNRIKKCFITLLIPFFALALFACDGGTSGKPRIEKFEILPYRTSIAVNIIVENGSSVAKDSMKLRIYEGDSDTVKNSWTVKEKISTEQTFTFSSLKVDQEYTITLSATYNRQDNEIKRHVVNTSLLGSEEQPKEINTIDDFLAMPTDLSAHYVLKSDLDFLVDSDSEETEEKVKKVIDPLFSSEFTGSIDGDGHTISNFKIVVSRNHMGLFGNLGSKAKVKNLTISEAAMDITRVINGNIGIVAGWNQGLIENVHVVDSSIKYVTSSTSNLFAGGFVGLNAGTIKDSSITNSTMNVLGGTFSCIGGFVGFNQSTAVNRAVVENCYSDVAITGGTSTSSSKELDIKLHLGGFAGNNSGEITLSYAKGSMTEIKAECPNVEAETVVDKFVVSIGGFIGTNTGIITQSATFVAVEFTGLRVVAVRFGGFCGYNTSTGIINKVLFVASDQAISSFTVSEDLAADPKHFGFAIGLDNFSYNQEFPEEIFVLAGMKYVINETDTHTAPAEAYVLPLANLADTLAGLGFEESIVAVIVK